MRDQKKEKDCILFDFGEGRYQEATPKEVEMEITPTNAESVLVLKNDGTYSVRFVSSLG